MQNNILRCIPTLDLPVNDSFSISDKRLRYISLSTSLQRRDLLSVFIASDPSTEILQTLFTSVMHAIYTAHPTDLKFSCLLLL